MGFARSREERGGSVKKLIAPETLAKIEKRWPHLRPSCVAAGITNEEQIHRVIASAALRCEVGYLFPVECLRLAEVCA